LKEKKPTKRARRATRRPKFTIQESPKNKLEEGFVLLGFQPAGGSKHAISELQHSNLHQKMKILEKMRTNSDFRISRLLSHPC